jgi:uncharacterized protein (DUF488 family)
MGIVTAERPKRRARGWAGAVVFDLGHSTRSRAELIELLRSFEIATLADIRTVPRSRHNPQFNEDELARALPRAGIAYVHVPKLGGLRRGLGDASPNRAWRNASFRGYADHMQTDEFAEGLEEVRERARAGPIALLCAEAVPWRCHRSLVADALFARGVVVGHIMGVGRADAHRPTAFARIRGKKVTYPGE